MMSASLAGRCVLVVEDDYLIATEFSAALQDRGIEVVGPVGSVRDALALIERTAQIDGAMLDVNVHGEQVFPVADRLRARQVPFVFATGYDDEVIPDRFRDVRRCEKPTAPSAVMRALFG